MRTSPATQTPPLQLSVASSSTNKRPFIPDGPCPRVSRDRQKPDRFVAVPASSRAHTSTTARLLTAVVPCVGGAHTDADREILSKCSKRLKSEAHAEPPVFDDVDSGEREKRNCGKPPVPAKPPGCPKCCYSKNGCSECRRTEDERRQREDARETNILSAKRRRLTQDTEAISNPDEVRVKPKLQPEKVTAVTSNLQEADSPAPRPNVALARSVPASNTKKRSVKCTLAPISTQLALIETSLAACEKLSAVPMKEAAKLLLCQPNEVRDSPKAVPMPQPQPEPKELLQVTPLQSLFSHEI